ncbi:MAG: adenylate/guanylate cyclase domain-containing protein [Nitrospinae bacterium]|nr:adenylate/guanylate cyclase domain-containing protein [Nitrospinota bacterium]
METATLPQISERLLDEKLAALEKARQWSPRVVSRLENLIRAGDDFSLFRINPVQYAKEKGMEEQEAIDVFLHATVAGLFQMNWHLLCPGCTSVVESFTTLKTFDCHYHCEICNVNFEAALDDYIQISFTVAPEIRSIPFHDPEKLSADDYLLKYRFSREGIMTNGEKWIDAVLPFLRHHSFVEPGERVTFNGEVTEGVVIFNDLLNHIGHGLPVTGAPDGGVVKVRLNGTAIEAESKILTPGKKSFEVRNESGKRGLLTLMNLPADYHERFAITFAPFLSGKRLLTSQSFRDLFHYEVVQGMESLGVKNIAIIFTDLKGSTALYERIGDLKAFSLVRQHFDILGKVVARNSGAIVKTIGDAVMGSFMNPRDALKAALEMQKEVAAMSQTPGGKDIILKIGIHSGASIAVNLNERLDYFGQTVNIASRVQELAGADEICVTDDVYGYAGVKEQLGRMKVTPGKAKLKGVLDEMNVYRIAA